MSTATQSVERAAGAYRNAVLAGREAHGEVAIHEALAAGVSAVEIYDAVIAPAMYLVGDSWAAGALNVADEHLASALSSRMIALIDAAPGDDPPAAYPRHILLASPAGEAHTLGLQMADSALRRAGHRVTMLGAQVPDEDLISMLRRRRPDALGLTTTAPDGIASLHRLLPEIRRTAPELPVIVGGAPTGAPPFDARVITVGSIAEALRLLARPTLLD